MNRNRTTKINMICGIVALLCLATMFVPFGRERGHFDEYGQVLARGEMPYYIAHVIGAPGGSDSTPYMIGALLAVVSAILLLLWAFQSFKGTGKAGLAASIVNLLAAAFTALLCLSGAFDGSVTLPVVFAILALAIAALVLAILQKRAAKR